VLTALEAAGLDLWGTKLVVLSACKTHIEAVQNGEGVHGLRRALVMAGAESQVMSLWKVVDEAARDLRVAYYRRLLAGEGRGAAAGPTTNAGE
jgi:CHAT domain-containing protein